MNASNLYIKSTLRSCVTCSKAKAKCVRQPGAQICERCARLKKDCSTKEPVLRRRKPLKVTRTAQLEKLESKIEHLVNALSSQQAHRSSEPDQHPVSPAGDKVPIHPTPSDVLISLCHASGQHSSTSPTAIPSAVTSPPDISTDKLGTYGSMSGVEADMLLDRFRRLMAPGFPFIALPDGVTAFTLQEQKPFLLQAICTVALFHDQPRQQSLVKEMNYDIAERMFINNEKSLDLLQGLLVLVGWYHPHVSWSPQMTTFLHLAGALTIDLGIDRIATQCGDYKQATARAVHGPNLTVKTHTIEERRAFVWTYYLSNMLSSSFRKLDFMSFTPYMEHCLQSLVQAREYDSDLLLVQMVRIERLIESMHTPENHNVPSQIYIKAFQADLERLRQADPCNENNIFLRMQYLNAEITLWELSLSDLQENRDRSLSSHLEDLYCLAAVIQSFLEEFFSFPASSYHLLPFSVFSQFGHTFICLIKLSSLELEGWDRKVFNDKYNFIRYLDEAASRLDESARLGPDGISVNNENYSKWASKIRWMRQVYDAKFSGDGTALPAPCTHSAQDVNGVPDAYSNLQQQPTPPDDPGFSAEFFNYLDENFWDSFDPDYLMLPSVEAS